MRWPKGPPHLALNPPYLLFFCFFWFVVIPFLSLLCNTKKTLFSPQEKGIFWLFLSVSLCFSLAFLGLPLFQFIFLCLSLLLVRFPFFPVFLFCFILLPCFVSFFPFLSSLLLFHEKNNIRIFNYKVFLHQYFLFFGFLSSFLFESLFLIFVFVADLKLCFLLNIIVFWFQKNQVEKHQFLGKKGGCNKPGFL